MNNQQNYGLLIAFTGIVLGGGLFFYSSFLHTKKIRAKKDPKLLLDLFCGWLLACYLPLAIVLQSILIGYVVFVVFFHLLGFRTLFFGLGIALGWSQQDELQMSFKVSFFITFLYMMLKFGGLNSYYLNPFVSPICVFGTNIMFLAGIIMSSIYYRHRAKGEQWAQKNLMMIVMLIGCMYFGSVYGLIGLRNTAIVWFVLWCCEKYGQVFINKFDNLWFLIFSFSVLLYFIAVQIHQNPQFIISLFTSQSWEQI